MSQNNSEEIKGLDDKILRHKQKLMELEFDRARILAETQAPSKNNEKSAKEQPERSELMSVSSPKKRDYKAILDPDRLVTQRRSAKRMTKMSFTFLMVLLLSFTITLLIKNIWEPQGGLVIWSLCLMAAAGVYGSAFSGFLSIVEWINYLKFKHENNKFYNEALLQEELKDKYIRPSTGLKWRRSEHKQP